MKQNWAHDERFSAVARWLMHDMSSAGALWPAGRLISTVQSLRHPIHGPSVKCLVQKGNGWLVTRSYKNTVGSYSSVHYLKNTSQSAPFVLSVDFFPNTLIPKTIFASAGKKRVVREQ